METGTWAQRASVSADSVIIVPARLPLSISQSWRGLSEGLEATAELKSVTRSEKSLKTREARSMRAWCGEASMA